MSMLTAKQQSFITMMKTSGELAWKGFTLLLQRDDFHKFFESFEDAGFFEPTTNPAPVAGERENTVRVPYWQPLAYLKAVAKHAGANDDMVLANKVLVVVRTVSAWRDENGQPRRNYHTNSIFAEILGLVPTRAVELGDIDLLEQWLDDVYDKILIADALNKKVLPRFLNSADPVDWQKAAQVLFHATAIKWQEKNDGREPTPISVMDDFWLGELLTNHAKEIGRKVGNKATEITLARVREVFDTPIRRDQSSVFRPAVEDDPQNYQWRSAENRVVEALRDVVLGWAGKVPNDARAGIQSLLNDDLQIIRRVGIYILGQYWLNMCDLYTEIIAPVLFNNGHDHELYHLLQDHFADMSPEQQLVTVTAIETLPAPAYGDDPDRLRRHNQYRWFSAIKGKGYPAADQHFAKLDADPTVGKLGDHPDFDSYVTSWVGPGATPYSAEELMALVKANLLAEKLDQFVPRDNWHGSTANGLTSAIASAARTNPDLFFEGLSQFLFVKPIYQHAAINGLEQAWESKTEADWVRGWEKLVSFFEQVLANEQFWQQAQDMYQHWVVSVIADCLRAGMKDDQHAYDPGLLARTQQIIALLLQREPGVDTPAEDAMFQAMNCPKGRIIEALYSQALRAARVSDHQHGDHRKTWEGIRPLFENQLALCRDANYEFSTLTGNYLPQLQYLDGAWTSERIEQIFPIAYEANTVCALDGLAYASFTRPAYEVLAAHGVIERALSLELKGRSAREKLLERIGAAYVWGLETLDGRCMRRLFDTAEVQDLNVLSHVFWIFRNHNLAPEQRECILAFWEHCLDWAQLQQQVPVPLLSTLSLLATHITTIGPRERRLLREVAPYVHVGHGTYEFVAELLRLAPQDPKTISDTFHLMVAAHPPEYDYKDRIRSLLELLSQQGEKEKVILMTDRLRHLDSVQVLFKTLTRH